MASVEVTAPKDRTHEGPIRAAVEAKARPRAIADARDRDVRRAVSTEHAADQHPRRPGT